MSNHASELKALEERLKVAEERLKATAAGTTPVTLARRPAEALAAPIQERPKSGSRPGTGRKVAGAPAAHPPLPGARPPTPGTSGSEDEK